MCKERDVALVTCNEVGVGRINIIIYAYISNTFIVNITNITEKHYCKTLLILINIKK